MTMLHRVTLLRSLLGVVLIVQGATPVVVADPAIAPPDTVAVEGALPLRYGETLRVSPESGERFRALYVRRDLASLTVTPLTLPLADIRSLELLTGIRERVHPFMYVIAGAALLAGGIYGYVATKDKSTAVRVLATLGAGLGGVWLAGTIIPHGGGMQTVEVWVQVPLDDAE
jgi:hypothetical protein